MRKSWLGLAGFILLLIAAGNMVVRTEALGQKPDDLVRLVQSGEVIGFSSDVDANHQQVVLVDTKARAMSVYHVNRTTGEIALKSARNFRLDMQLEHYNGISPLPKEIQAMRSNRP